jgi:DNA-binding transcriptional MerR regulator
VANTTSEALELTYPLRTAARLTGLSPDLLRAWERRYGVVEPMRTPGGTRRYSTADLERLRLVKAAVDAGHRIGQVARLDLDELRSRVTAARAPEVGNFDAILQALEQLEGAEIQRLLSLQLSALGPVRFARDLVLPLIRELGEGWANGRIGVASEHLATGVLRSMLGSSLLHGAVSLRGPRIVFGTPPGERHELGLQTAALTALSAGANPIYIGADLPVDDLLAAAERADAAALALGIVSLPQAQVEPILFAIRAGLPEGTRLWIGGSGAEGLTLPEGVDRIETLGELEQRVALLGIEPPRAR